MIPGPVSATPADRAQHCAPRLEPTLQPTLTDRAQPWVLGGVGASARSAAGGGVGGGGDLGGGLFAEPDAAAQAGKVLVAGLGLELGGAAAVSG